MVGNRSSLHHLLVIANLKRLTIAGRTAGALRSSRTPMEGSTSEKGLQ